MRYKNDKQYQICHYQVRFFKLKMHQILFSAAGGAYDAPPDPVVRWGRGIPPTHSPPRSTPSASRFSGPLNTKSRQWFYFTCDRSLSDGYACIGIPGPGDDAGESDWVRVGGQPVQLHVDQQSSEQRLQQHLQHASTPAPAASRATCEQLTSQAPVELPSHQGRSDRDISVYIPYPIQAEQTFYGVTLGLYHDGHSNENGKN